ncbi:MAG: acyl-CoA dehydrogenase family protein [Euryarchaeota archaeon]|nr:acyl-CoA dehydrogenase family protein [Euryarchaeota archaeon]
MLIKATPEHELMRKTAREFIEKEVKPFVNQWEEAGEIPHEVFRKMGKLGILGAPIPPEYGGAGLDSLGYAMLTEEVARGCSSLRTTVSVNTSLAGMTLLHFASEAQKQKWLTPIATGERRGAWALSEPEAGSDAANQQTTAVRKGDKWIVNGRKIWISDGDIADYVVFFARTSPVEKDDRHKGISVFMVEKGTPGFQPGTVWTTNKLGLRASHTAELVFEDCEIPADHMIGKEGDGWKVAMTILNFGRLSVAAGAVGIMSAALDASIEYVKNRKTFGRAIGRFQLVQELIAEMTVDLEASRHLVYHAAAMKDAGLDNRQAVSIAKLFTAEAAMRVTENAVQLHGGVGYTQDMPVERYFRDAKICGIYEGTNEIQKLIIAEHALSLEK